MRRTWVVLTVSVLAAAVLVTGLDAGQRQKKPQSMDVKADEVAKVREALPQKPTVAPKKSRKLLIFNLCRGFRHGSIPIGAKALELMGEKTGAYTSVSTLDPEVFRPQSLKQFDAVVFNNTTGTLFDDEELKKSLLAFVASGRGIVGVHASTDCFYKWAEFGEMMGGYFSGHPWHEKVGIKLDDPSHPLLAVFGGKAFVITDEIYQFRDPYSRASLRVLLSLDTNAINMNKRGIKRTDGDFAVSWIRRVGKGRVFYCSLGHRNEIFWNPTILKYYLDGIQYACGDLPADATPSARLSPAPKPALVPDQINPQKKKAEGPTPLRVKTYAAPPASASRGKTITLFDGKDLSNWMNAGGKAPGAGWVIEDHAMVRNNKAGNIWTKQRFADFVLDLEFKTEGNSGIFIRTDNPRDCVQTGIEIQIDLGRGRQKVGKNGVGSIYDCLAPTTNPVKDGQWNRAVITANDNKITVAMNGVQIIDMDLNRWTEPRKNPDGSKNKFRTALKDFKREGHIGFQDHGAKVAYRNVKITPLGAKKK